MITKETAWHHADLSELHGKINLQSVTGKANQKISRDREDLTNMINKCD